MPKPPTEPPVAPAKPRKPRAKSDYIIQKRFDEPAIGAVGGQAGFADAVDAAFEDVAHAVGHIKQNNMEGEFRIVAVKRLVTAEKVQRTEMKLT